MTGYLDRLAARLVEPSGHIRPRPRSRFEVEGAPAASVDEFGTAGETDTLLAPARHAQPPRIEDYPREGVRRFQPDLPSPVEAMKPPAGPRHAAGTQADPTPPSALDVPKAGVRGVGVAPRLDALAPVPETADVPRLHSQASGRAMPAFAAASVEAARKAQDEAALPTIEDRVSPWRSPIERLAERAIDARTTPQAPQAPQAPLATPMPRQRDKPEAAVDDRPAVVQVTIGRLEVRAPEAARQPSAKPRRAAPRMSLQDYLQRRTEGRPR